MSIVTPCTAPGCETLTIGPLCLVHDRPVERVFVRGRPYRGEEQELPDWRPAAVTRTTAAPRLRTASASGAAAPLRR